MTTKHSGSPFSCPVCKPLNDAQKSAKAEWDRVNTMGSNIRRGSKKRDELHFRSAQAGRAYVEARAEHSRQVK